MIDIYCASYARPPREVTLDIDDTVDVVHGHSNSRCSTRITASVAFFRSTSTTPRPRARWRCCCDRARPPRAAKCAARSGAWCVASGAHWPETKLTIRGDSHYGRLEAMAWCEANGVDYIFGLGGNDVLDRKVEAAADDVRVRCAEGEAPVVRRYAETRYGAESWKCERRVAARIEASCNGLDIRYVVTNITRGSAEWLYDTLYCERGQTENLIKLHKTQLASDRTSCRSPLANQVRLVLHTARLLVAAGAA